MRWYWLAPAIVLAGALQSRPALGDDGCGGGRYDSTFALIEKAIFENRGCTSAVCHGAAASGGLDLRPGAAHESLIDVPATTVPNRRRVVPGQAAESLLWLNLASKTLPGEWEAPLRSMPLDPLPALSHDELEAVRRWLELGAPKDGVVPGTAELLDACLPPPEPLSIAPLPPPPAGRGLQMKMPGWVLAAQSELEVCFATYYDVSDQVPAAARGPGGTTFRYRFHETRQNPLSHHLAPLLYEGAATVTDPAWGEWRCQDGERDGAPCDPFDRAGCGADGQCATPRRPGAGCVGYGPGDGAIGSSSPGISVTQETAGEFPLPPGVYEELPLKGMILWTSHAFNLTEKPGKIEAWANFEFAAVDAEQVPARKFLVLEEVFKLVAPAFSTDEPCSVFTFPENSHVFEWSSHMHQRGRRWRTFRGAFRCASGPAAGAACSPFGYDFDSPDVCAGAPCTAPLPDHVGDCDLSGGVSVEELVTAVGIGLGQRPWNVCAEVDRDRSYRVTVDEIVAAVGAALHGVPPARTRDPDASLFYVSLIYNDPRVLRPAVPTVMRGTDDERSVTYCALYDNGFTDPDRVKTRAGSPPSAAGFPGGPCDVATHCTAGRVGMACAGEGDAARDRSCDSSAGAGDGVCDACTLRGGVTTEDDMFLLLGRYFIPGGEPS